MSIAQLLAGLQSRGILLHLENGELRYRSPRGALTEADRAALRARTSEITGYLAACDAGHALRTLTPGAGPLTPTVVQEMWYRFAGPPQEGKPVAINISGHTVARAAPQAVTAAIGTLIARHDVLRTAFRVEDQTLLPFLLPAEAFVAEQMDMRALSPEAARATAMTEMLAFCGRLKPVSGGWLTQALVIALPEGETMAAISSSHIVSDAASRNILLDELYDLLEGRALPPIQVLHNDYGLAERALLDGAQGQVLVEHWRRWYAAQLPLKAPSNGTPLLWGTGIRIVRNFDIPTRVMARGRALAAQMKMTPFMVHLTIFCLAIARWAGVADFPIRILGDKRNSEALSGTVGILYCGDAVDIHAAPDADFETVMRAILTEYDSALSRRIPTLHYYAPQMVKPGIEADGFPNRIPAVFNYYAAGTAREKAAREARPDPSAAWPWPPAVAEMPPAVWPRVSSPIFLHLMDNGADANASLHFYQDAVPPEDQRAFTALLFQIYEEVLPA